MNTACTYITSLTRLPHLSMCSACWARFLFTRYDNSSPIRYHHDDIIQRLIFLDSDPKSFNWLSSNPSAGCVLKHFMQHIVIYESTCLLWLGRLSIPEEFFFFFLQRSKCISNTLQWISHCTLHHMFTEQCAVASWEQMFCCSADVKKKITGTEDRIRLRFLCHNMDQKEGKEKAWGGFETDDFSTLSKSTFRDQGALKAHGLGYSKTNKHATKVINYCPCGTSNLHTQCTPCHTPLNTLVFCTAA